MQTKVKEEIVFYVLQSMLKYGEATQKSVLGKVLANNPQLKKDIKSISQEIGNAIKNLSSLSKDEVQSKLHSIKPPALEKKREEKKLVKKTLPELKKVKGKYVFRFEPSPSGALHIGHMLALLLNSEYARKYKGKLILRISDTNPGNIYEPAYTLIEEEAQWITQNNVAEVVVQSTKVDDYYKHAVELIHKGHLYICSCDTEAFRQLMVKKQACPCRTQSPDEAMELWNKMFTDYSEGEVVARVKTDVKHKNPAVRDWPAFRINLQSHPLHGKKYRVWPLMNFAVAIDDHEGGLTHIIRGKDHIVNMDRQKYIYDYFGWSIPEYIHTGRINFTGIKISSSEFTKDILAKKYTGWDDIRLPTAAALRKRGFTPEAFVKFVHELGPSKVDKTVSFKEFMLSVCKFNKESIEPVKRFFFVEKGKKVKIIHKLKKARAPLHPEQDIGSRGIPLTQEFLIEDALDPKKTYRLMHLCNIKNQEVISEGYDPKLKAQLIHWLPFSKDLVNVQVTMDDGSTIKGKAEPDLSKVKEGEVVQFERKFFARCIHKKKDHIGFYFLHK